MKTRDITITLEKAREWYNSGIEPLKELALQAFHKEELKFDYKNVTTFEEACKVLGFSCDFINKCAENIARFSKSSAAMLKLNIVRKALNLGQDLYLTKNPKDTAIYYPINPIITLDSTYFNDEIKIDKIEIIGEIKSDGVLYYVLNGDYYGSNNGLADFYHDDKVGFAPAGMGFLGCASEEIARHLGKYFGMLITEAKYGDIVGFEIVRGCNCV